MIAPNSMEQLLNVAVIEDVVGDYVSLKRAGSRFKGLCPFHDEKTPSFVVTPALGIYKCFGCQKGGNALNFLMEMETMSYVEAARTLAKRYGIELIETGQADNEEYRNAQKVRENIQIVLDYAQQFFADNLVESEEGRTIGLAYFHERGFTNETISKWGLGYSPSGWEVLTHKARDNGYTLENMELAGLIRKKENGEYFDLFRNRVIFPIHSVSGKTIAFAGRKMTSTDPSPKYVNSPETELYKKSDILFGIYQAKNSIKQHNKVYLTEGYTDVITLSQYGIENVVASSGTALTPGQIKLVRRFTPNITVVYDGDKAGIKASLRGINLLLAEDLNVRVVPLPEGEDPDSFCKSLGSEAFASYIEENEENFIFFKARLLLEGVGNDPIKKTEAVRDILDSLAEIRDPLKRNALNHELAGICQMDEALLAAELGKLVRGKIADTGKDILAELKQITEAAGVDLPRESLTDEAQERAFVRLLLLHGEKPFNEEITIFEFAINELANDEIIEFTDGLCSGIVQGLKELEPRQFPGQQYFIQHQDAEIASWAAGVLSEGLELSPAYADNYIFVVHENENFKQELVSIFVHLRRKKLDNLIRAAIEKLKDDTENTDEAMMYIEYLSSVKMRIAQELGGAVFHFGNQ
jgi:DNA primase